MLRSNGGKGKDGGDAIELDHARHGFACMCDICPLQQTTGAAAEKNARTGLFCCRYMHVALGMHLQ